MAEKRYSGVRSGERGSRVPDVRRRSDPCSLQRLRRLLYPRESVDDLLNPVFYLDLVVECVASFYVMACLVWAMMTLKTDSYQPNTTHFGLFAGFIIMTLIEAYGPISGAPINPAACLGFFVAGRISLVRGVCSLSRLRDQFNISQLH